MAGPPGTGLAFLLGSGVAIAVEEGSDEGGWCIGEGVEAHEAEESAVVGEEALDEVEEPAAVARNANSARGDYNGKRQEPDEPVEPKVVRRDLGRSASRVARLGFEGVFAPLRGGSDDAIGGAFDDDLVALAADLAEGAVGSNEMEGVVAVIHHLVRGDEIESGLDAQGHGSGGEQVKKYAEGERALNKCGCVKRDYEGESAIVECGEAEDDGEPVEPGVVAADDEQELLGDEEGSGGDGDGLGREEQEGDDDLDEVAYEGGEAVH